MAGPLLHHRSERSPASASDPGTSLLASRLRSGAWIVLLGSALFATTDVLRAHAGLAGLLAVKLLQCVILATLVFLVRRVRDPERLRWIGAVAVGAVYFTTVLSGVLRGELLTALLLVLATAMATATFAPWGGRAQLFSVACAALAMAYGGHALTGELSHAAIYPWLASGIVLLGSVWVAREHERQQRIRQEAERMLAVESRVSSALARVGEEMIRSESTPGVLDGLCGLVAELLSCDQTALVLYDAGENAFAVHSSFGHRPSDWEQIRTVRVSARSIKPILDGFHAHGLVEIDTRDVRHPDLRALHDRHRVSSSLYVPLRHGGEIAGVICAHYRDRVRRFSDAQKRIAVGTAHLASMALQNARLLEELREANRLKSDFVSTMSHELRTPVSVILGYTEMLGDELPVDERDGILARVRRSGLELLELVEDTLNLSRLEAGRDPPSVEPVDVPTVFADLAADFAAMVPLQHVALRWDGPQRFVVPTDRRKLRMILKNLVGNALKFTVRGEVVVSCRRDGDVARFVVRDTGIGIAPQHLPIIFDMFRQVDSSDRRSYRGAGLGLHIVQRLVHQLGGDIQVASEVGRGSVFTFTLPITEGEHAELPSRAPSAA